MKHPDPIRDRNAAFAVLVLLNIGCMALWGWRGVVGLTLGTATTWFNCWALWSLVKLLGSATKEGLSNTAGTVFVITAFLVKIPILIGVGMAVRLLGGAAFPCFLAGLTMVYSGLVGWAQRHG